MPADSLVRAAARAGNALRRLAAGLPMRGGVSPEVPNDLFVAHLAAYHLAARHAAGRRVLDLGCGTGYGAPELARAGASEVVGLDPDTRSLAYARRFAPAPVRFVAGRAEDLPWPLGDGAASFDLVVAANLLAHLADPGAALDGARRVLAPDGTLIATVPPIVDDRMMEQQRAGGVHRSNRYLWDWERLLRPRFRHLRLFRLAPPASARLDLSDPRRSRLRAEEFSWDEVSLAVPSGLGTLAAAFVVNSPLP